MRYCRNSDSLHSFLPCLTTSANLTSLNYHGASDENLGSFELGADDHGPLLWACQMQVLPSYKRLTAGLDHYIARYGVWDLF